MMKVMNIWKSYMWTAGWRIICRSSQLLLLIHRYCLNLGRKEWKIQRSCVTFRCTSLQKILSNNCFFELTFSTCVIKSVPRPALIIKTLSKRSLESSIVKLRSLYLLHYIYYVFIMFRCAWGAQNLKRFLVLNSLRTKKHCVADCLM